MNISMIIADSVISVSMDDTLEFIKKTVEKHHFHHIPVTEGKKLIGIISDRDLLKQLTPSMGTDYETRHDLEILKKKAHLIMTRKPITINKNATTEDATNILIRNNISCLPVVSDDNTLTGIVTMRDILIYTASIKQTGEVKK